MLTEKLEVLFSEKRLMEALERYRDEADYASLAQSVKEGSFADMLSKGFIPDPMRGFEIPKSSGEMRQLAMASTASKVIQRVIADALIESVQLSDKSYAFRPGKGPVRAVGRAKDYIRNKKFTHVAKADIDDFFDTIDQEKLIAVLEKIVADRRIVVLISLFLKNGMLQKKQWVDKSEGVYQGDVLSPVLSNIYLHAFDTMLEERNIAFVRFADDMVFFANSEAEAKRHFTFATKVLEALSLCFGEEKCYIASVEEGFEFLGLRFRGEEVAMDNERLMKKLSTLSQKSKKKPLEASVAFFNEYIQGLKRYYLKSLDDMSQLVLIEEHIDTILIHKVARAKQSKTINNKSRFVQILAELDGFQESSHKERKEHAKALVSKAYESIALNNPLETAEKMMAKKKTDVLREQLKSSELVLNRYGLYVSLSKGKVVVKEYGKTIHKIPVNWLTRIIVMTRGASLSTSLIFECAKRKIDIDFIDKRKPMAQITYFQAINNELHTKQLEAKQSEKGLHIARAIVKAKIKNQTNLLKYHLRYRVESNPEEAKKLQTYITQMQEIAAKLKKAGSVSELMGYEGSASASYWRGFGLLIGDASFERETQNAPDAVNQALNYGYAFLYQRVQSALLKNGVNIYHSFLHVQQANKPTLVFDMIEPFRQPVVDREVISILNRGMRITSSKGRLSKKSVKVITENVQERLATPTRWRKGKFKITTIIEEQALELAHVVEGVKSRFKGFVVRY